MALIIGSAALERKLDDNTRALNQLKMEIKDMAGEMVRLQAAVARLDAIDDSIIALLNGVVEQLRALIEQGADPAALSKLADDVNAQADALAAAVLANTPAGPTGPTGPTGATGGDTGATGAA